LIGFFLQVYSELAEGLFQVLVPYHQAQNYQKSLVILNKYLLMSGLKHPVRHNTKQDFKT
jgi:hypothetical protein